MSPKTTLLELDDPLGGAVLESQVTFGVRAATLAGYGSEPTGPDDWCETLFCASSCSIGFTPPEPDEDRRPAFDQ